MVLYGYGETDMAGEENAVTKTTSLGSTLSDVQNGLTKYIPIPVLTLYTTLDALLRTQTATLTLIVFWWGLFIVFLLFSFAFAWKFTEEPPMKRTRFLDILTRSNLDLAMRTNLADQFVSSMNEWERIVESRKFKRGCVAVIAFLAFVMALGGPFTTLSVFYPAYVWQGYFGAGALAVATLIILYILDKEEI
jgi:hypothetical protein